jgi:hypothetical protein
VRLCAVCGVRCAMCGTLIHAVGAVCAAVCGSAHGSVWLCGSACGSVRQYAAVRLCARQCMAVRSAAVCGSPAESIFRQREKIARVFCWRTVTFPEAEINSMQQLEAAAAFCLPTRCGVGVPPWATASRKCLAVLIGGWEPSLLQVTTIW